MASAAPAGTGRATASTATTATSCWTTAAPTAAGSSTPGPGHYSRAPNAPPPRSSGASPRAPLRPCWPANWAVAAATCSSRGIAYGTAWVRLPCCPLTEDQFEANEMFQNAGEKGQRYADSEDPPRRRSSRRRGLGTFANDRPPVAGWSGARRGRCSCSSLDEYVRIFLWIHTSKAVTGVFVRARSAGRSSA